MISIFSTTDASSAAGSVEAADETACLTQEIFGSAEAPPAPSIEPRNEDAAESKVQVPQHVTETWSKARERRFSYLVEAEALEQISSEEKDELEQLQELRDRFKNPMSAVEILYTYQRHQSENQVFEALKKHAIFLRSANHAKTSRE